MRLSNRDRFILRVAAGYAVIAAIWFALSDRISALFSSSDSYLVIDGAMDVGFVIVTTLSLIATLRRVPMAAPLPASSKRSRLHLLWYPFAILSTLAVLLLRLAAGATWGTQPGLILFVIPLTLSAYFGGLGPGLVATILSGIVTAYFLLTPIHSFYIEGPLAQTQWLVLLAIGGLLSFTFAALKRSRDEAYRIAALQSSIVASSQDAIYSVSPDGTVTSWNPAAEKLFGYGADEIIGRNIATISAPGEEGVMRDLVERLARGDSVSLLRVRRLRKNGTIADVSLSASPVYNAEGLIVGSSRISRDISSLVRAEKVQQAHLATMRAFVDQAPIMIAMLDRGMNYLAASQLWTKEYGGGHADLTGLNHYAILGHVPDEWRDVNGRALAGETIANESDKWVRADGSVRWLRSVVQPWTDAEGKIGGIIIVDDDQTERKKAADALRESEERFAAIFRESPVGIVIFDLHDHCRLIDFNDTWLKIIGYSRAEMTGKTGFDLELWPDPVVHQAMYDQIDRPMAVWHAEMQMRHKGGALVDTVLTMRQIEIAGRPLGIALVSDDSTRKNLERDLRRARDQLTAFIDASPIAIIGVDASDHVLTWSRAAADIFGFTASEALGRRFSDLVPPAPEYTADLEDRAKRRAQGEVTRSLPSQRRRKDGSWAKLSVSAGDLKDENGKLAGAILVVEDVTEREKLQEQLAQSQKMEAIGQLTGGVAHDFNNLLTVVLGNLELLQDHVSDEGQLHRWIGSAIDAGRGGADLVHRLLAFSRRQPLEPTVLDVNQRIMSFVPLLKRTLGEAIEVRYKLTSAVWPVMIDAAQFDSALLNLSVNARDAMPDGGWIEIATENVVVDEAYASQMTGLAAGDFVRVSVSDAGHGMTPDIVARVFDPFFTTKEIGKGSGLGLSMVYGFIRQSGGHVSIYSEPGKGTVVKLLLPRAGVFDLTRTTPKEKALGAPQGTGETILVVEDDPDVRAVTVEFLLRLGYVVLDTSRAADALGILADHPEIGLLFTDIVLMGGETGVALAAQAKAVRPDIRVLFASGYTEDALERNRQLGTDYLLLHKPFTKVALAAKVREALGLEASAGE